MGEISVIQKYENAEFYNINARLRGKVDDIKNVLLLPPGGLRNYNIHEMKETMSGYPCLIKAPEPLTGIIF